jgi:hypothetical protein
LLELLLRNTRPAKDQCPIIEQMALAMTATLMDPSSRLFGQERTFWQAKSLLLDLDQQKLRCRYVPFSVQ